MHSPIHSNGYRLHGGAIVSTICDFQPIIFHCQKQKNKNKRIAEEDSCLPVRLPVRPGTIFRVALPQKRTQKKNNTNQQKQMPKHDRTPKTTRNGPAVDVPQWHVAYIDSTIVDLAGICFPNSVKISALLAKIMPYWQNFCLTGKTSTLLATLRPYCPIIYLMAVQFI